MKPVVLPLLCHNEDTALFNELGVAYNYQDLDEVEFMFFNIDYACGNFRDGREFTEIVSNEETFVVNLSWNEFKKLFI
jgi:hypothetical protein